MSIVDSNLPTSGRSAITTIDQYMRQQVALWWDSLDENHFFHEFMRALVLAKEHNQPAVTELMRDLKPISMNDMVKTYCALLKISADALHSHLIKPAANDD